MFRFLRTRPNILSLSRRTNSLSTSYGISPGSSSSPQIFRLQRVKVRRKWFRPMNFVMGAGVFYACYQVYTSTVFGTLGDWLDEQEAQMTEKERKELDDEIEPFIIPLPFTTKQVEPLPYRGSDPEWQTFIKVSKNHALVRDLEYRLAYLCKAALENHPLIVHRYGKDIRIVRYMMNVLYPSKPPPTFVRKGIIIDDDGIYIDDRPVSSWDVFRIKRILWPSALTMSLWSFTGALMKQNASAVAKVLGQEQQTDQAKPNLQQTLEKIQQQMQKPQQKDDSKSPSPLPPTNNTPTDPATANTPPASSSGPSAGVGGNNPLPAAPNQATGKQRSARDIYAVKVAQEHTSGPWQAFKQKLSQSWQPLRDYPPRGSISVSGVVEFDTPRSRLTLDVFAWWDPKSGKFDSRSLVIRVRAIRPKTQNPLR